MRGASSFDTLAATGEAMVSTIVDIVVYRSPRDPVGPVSIALASQPMVGRASVLIDMGDVTEVGGMEIPTTTLSLSDVAVVGFGGATLQELGRLGLLDGADVKVSRIYTLGAQSETMLDFSGYIDQALPTPHGIECEMKAWPGVLAAATLPRHVVSPWCRHQFLDAGCGLARTGREVDVSVASGTATYFVASSMTGIDSRYAGGSILALSGRNVGFVRTVELVSGGQVRIAPPGFPWPLQAGDQLRMTLACRKSFKDCQAFGNEQRFGGFPYVPAPESI